MRPEGKRAILTGAGSAFSAGIARACLAEGTKVMIADITGGMPGAVVERAGGLTLPVDVADGRSVAHPAERTQDAMGGIDILVNNAGITHLPGAMEEIDEEDFDRVFAVNCKSIYLTTRELLPSKKAARAGTILTATLPPPAAAQLLQRIQWLGLDRDQGDGGRACTDRHPRGRPTYGSRARRRSRNGFSATNTGMRAKALSTIPLARFSTPGDMGTAALYPWSDEAAMVTGMVLEMDGGQCI